MDAEETQDGILLHFHLSDNTPSEEAMLGDTPVIWKDVLIEGKYPMSPGPGGAVSKPMTVVPDGESDYDKRTIAMSDLVEAHKDGAFKYVTIPTRHKDDVLDNTGYIPRPEGVRVVEREGKKVFQAALGFTEPDVKGKVQRGTIPDVSGGILFNFVNKHTKKMYRAAMKHVALTGTPFMGNLEPFKPVFASDDEIEIKEVQFYQFAEDDNDNSGSSSQSNIIWDERTGLNWVRESVETALRPQSPDVPDDSDEVTPRVPQPSYFVEDVSRDNTALVTEYFRGDRSRYVIPFEVDGEDVKVAPSTRWVAVKEAMIAASDDFEAMSADTLRDKLSVKLSEDLDSEDYRIEKVTLDRRARISTENGAAWIADFSVNLNGDVQIAPPHQWEKVESPKPSEKKDDKRQSSTNVVSLHDVDTMKGRLAAARKNRRQLVSS